MLKPKILNIHLDKNILYISFSKTQTPYGLYLFIAFASTIIPIIEGIVRGSAFSFILVIAIVFISLIASTFHDGFNQKNEIKILNETLRKYIPNFLDFTLKNNYSQINILTTNGEEFTCEIEKIKYQKSTLFKIFLPQNA